MPKKGADWPRLWIKIKVRTTIKASALAPTLVVLLLLIMRIGK